ncbi:DUF2795 domain-containing protein [Salinibacterium sp. SYSU T00001]|uniref:DUF2795 domain-containing protein n=1 Tax=Homoserinimonas sedimenticola TaxID=2986805 RepID=UPI00223543A1|nr:DUF2795 domain-containing protein [Salinibacterium sedimenticola]MCW4384932.1 DUF2795 domain-containing protein [Salinibacterium sedimenticola]
MNSIHSLTGVLSAIEFPATRDDILRLARTDFVDRRLARWLESLPDGSYDGAWQICQALASESGHTTANARVPVSA